MLLPCIVCDKVLEPAMVGIETNQPYGGTCFRTHGHYGSTVFDPMEAETYLEVNICDLCLIELHDSVLEGWTHSTYRYHEQEWVPEVTEQPE